MKLIKPDVFLIDQGTNLKAIYEHIEKVARVSYKSEEKMAERGSESFIEDLIKLGHTSPFEHGTVYLKINKGNEVYKKYLTNQYSRYHTANDNYYITTNMRVIIQNEWQEDLQYVCEPTEYHEIRITAKFICSRAISHELVRHRVFSFMQESQRYCNYSKDKFDHSITFIDPLWHNQGNDEIFTGTLKETESDYFRLLDARLKPQEAREVLPNCTKTELYMTGYLSDWTTFFNLRCDSKAHPEMQKLAKLLLTQMYDLFPIELSSLRKKYLLC